MILARYTSLQLSGGNDSELHLLSDKGIAVDSDRVGPRRKFAGIHDEVEVRVA